MNQPADSQVISPVTVPITPALAEDFFNCRVKVFLKTEGNVEPNSSFETLQQELSKEHSQLAHEYTRRRYLLTGIRLNSVDIRADLTGDADLILDAHHSDAHQEWLFDAIDLRRTPPIGNGIRPIRFSHRSKLTPQDRILAASDGTILQRILGVPIAETLVIHGSIMKSTVVKLNTTKGPTLVSKKAALLLDDLRAQIAGAAPAPKLSCGLLLT